MWILGSETCLFVLVALSSFWWSSISGNAQVVELECRFQCSVNRYHKRTQATPVTRWSTSQLFAPRSSGTCQSDKFMAKGIPSARRNELGQESRWRSINERLRLIWLHNWHFGVNFFWAKTLRKFWRWILTGMNLSLREPLVNCQETSGSVLVFLQ